MNNAGIKIAATLIIMTTLTVLGMLDAYPTITIYAQENMTTTNQNMTNTDQNMTELGFGTISGAARGTS
ncbi:MAG TPA: hypothetical protein VJ697_12605 [Nitrososphaeraceae archaeon]|nr:hypothetical protein [Nitrososphaeraceae archaeon]